MPCSGLPASAIEWVEDEALIDAVTAVSGSGPAYVFHLVEAMAAAARRRCRLACRSRRCALRAATVAGSGELLHRSDLPAATLRQNVTSPGGTTAAALAVLMAEDGLAPLVEKAVLAWRASGQKNWLPSGVDAVASWLHRIVF